MKFSDRLTERTQRLETRLCLGLDPRLEHYRDAAQLRTHTLEVLEACAPLVVAVKPQFACYEALGLEGIALLLEVCAAAQALDLPLILDAKRGDIGSTAELYASAWLSGRFAGAALTVNPLLGFDTLLPFVRAARAGGGAIYVLVKTSNPGSGDVQDMTLRAPKSRPQTADSEPPGTTMTLSEHLALEVARLGREEVAETSQVPSSSSSRSSALSSVGAVVGATYPAQLERLRALMPHAPLLLPGLGAQGAAPGDLAPAFLEGGLGAVVSASRGIQYAEDLKVDSAHRAARAFRDALNAAIHAG